MADSNWKESDPFHGTEIPSWLPVLVTAVFFLAAWFFYSNRSAAAAAGKDAFVVRPEYYDTAPVRAVGKRLEAEGMACGDCHDPAAGPSANNPRVAPEVHARVVLKHGSNDRCFNCHSNGKRDFFAAYGSETIPFSSLETLCRKCHGPTYRDWTRGVHGRRSGYWNKSAGEQKPLPCIACHNPHDPAFKPLIAAPAPQKRGKD